MSCNGTGPLPSPLGRRPVGASPVETLQTSEALLGLGPLQERGAPWPAGRPRRCCLHAAGGAGLAPGRPTWRPSHLRAWPSLGASDQGTVLQPARARGCIRRLSWEPPHPASGREPPTPHIAGSRGGGLKVGTLDGCQDRDAARARDGAATPPHASRHRSGSDCWEVAPVWFFMENQEAQRC